MNRSRISSRRVGKLSLLLGLVLVLASVMPVTQAVAQPSLAPAAAPDAPNSGTISGTVFRDYNEDGTQQTKLCWSRPILSSRVSPA